MAVAKVTLNGTTLMDTTDATASADKILNTYTAYIKDGTKTVGTLIPSSAPNLQTKAATPTESAQTIEPDSGFDGLSSVEVGAISADYVGSNVPVYSSPSDVVVQQKKTNTTSVIVSYGFWDDDIEADLPEIAFPSSASASATSGYMSKGAITPSTADQYLNIPTGYNTTGDYYTISAMPSGTAGTPTATKGSVSNHSVSVTPSVTNTTGYITGGTQTGTAVTVSASELVSGTLNVTSSGTKDVTNYASASIPSGTEGTPSATKGTVSNHSVSVTPSVTNGSGFISGGTHTGTAVTVSASELVSGSQTITDNGTTDVTNLASVTVAVPYVTYYTGTGTPSSSTGSDGDIYLKVV